MAKSKQKHPTPDKLPQNHKSDNSATPPLPIGGLRPLWPLAVFALAIAIGTWLAYKGAFDNKFVSWDDQTYVQENPILTNPTPANIGRLDKALVSNNFHPVTMRTLLWDVRKHGIKAGPIIQTNVLLHVLNSCLVLLFVWLLTRGRWIVAGFTAALFALHPMHVESVAWVSERKDVLYVFFGLLSLLSYWYYVVQTSKGRGAARYGWLALTLGLLVLSCLSKAMAVVFPLLYLLVDYWESRNMTFGVWLEKLPFFALSLLFGLIALAVQKGQNFHGWFEILEVKNAVTTAAVFTSFQKICYASYGWAQYCWRLFWPFGLCTYYPYPTHTAGAALPYVAAPAFLVAYLGVAVWAWHTAKKALFFGLAFAFVSVVLVLQFISVGSVIMADRYTYLPYVGLLFALLWYADQYAVKPAHRYATLGLLSAFTLYCAVLTARQVEVWQDSISLWSRVIELYPDAAAPYARRGNAWGKERGDLAKARTDFEKAIQLDTNDAYAYEGLGIVAGMQRDHAKALEMFDKCVQLDPNYFNFYFNRATAKAQVGQHASALADFEKALELNPGNYAMFISPYLFSTLASGDTAGAKAKADEAIARLPNVPDIYVLRAQAKILLGDKSGAKTDIETALRLNPNHAGAQRLMGTL